MATSTGAPLGAPPPSSAPLPPSVPGAPVPSPDQIADDVRTIIGGMAGPAHIGPEAADQLMARFHANELAYMREAEVQAQHATAVAFADLFFYSPALMVAHRAPADAAPFVTRMLALYKNALANVSTSPKSEHDRQVRRLQEAVEGLEKVSSP